MRLGGVQVWFDAPVFARFVSNAVRIGADDVLTRIDALMDWRWFSPICKPRVGVLRDLAPGLRSSGPLQLSADRAMAPQSWSMPSNAVGFHTVLRSRTLCTCAR
ncbi:MAG: hypothetical protein GDA36_12105 [Rhodobacteraceae bacterium]|nr:hypothetical protein [Paracoccaceae bacterium]